MPDPLLTDALALAHRTAQHALAVLAGTTGLDREASGQVTASLSSALVSLAVAADFAASAWAVWSAPCPACQWSAESRTGPGHAARSLRLHYALAHEAGS